MPIDAFISYSHKDKATADAACATLEAAGVRCWIAPRDVAPGADWSGAIVDAIRTAKVFVLIYSAEADTSRQIRNEIVQATNAGLAIVPFRIEDIPPSDALSYHLSGVHWLDALTPPLEAHLGALVWAVRHLLALAAPSEAGADPRGNRSPPNLAAARYARPTWIAWALVAAAVIALSAASAIFWMRAVPSSVASQDDPTALSFDIVAAGALSGSAPVELTAPSGRLMTCTAGNQQGRKRQCQWK